MSVSATDGPPAYFPHYGPQLGTDGGRHTYCLGPCMVSTEEADDPSATAHVQDDLVLQGLLVLQDDTVVFRCARLVSQHFQVKFLKTTHQESLQEPGPEPQSGTLPKHPPLFLKVQQQMGFNNQRPTMPRGKSNSDGEKE